MPAVVDLDERLRCDTPFYSENALRIVDKRGRVVPLVPNGAQLEFDRRLEEQRSAGLPMRAIVLKARQLGCSTWTQAKILQRVTQDANHAALTVAQDRTTAAQLFGIGEFMYSMLPEDAVLKPKIRSQRRLRELTFGEPSSIARATGDVGLNSSLTVDTAKEIEAGRGFTYRSLHCSEAAFWPDLLRKLTGLLNTVPDEPDTLIVIESTANGHNHFKTLWDQAEAGENDYAPIFFPWHSEPAYARAFETKEEKAAFVVSIGTGAWGEDEPMLQELYDVSPEQLHWRRWAIVNRCQGDLRTFQQEYPACLTAETRVSTEQGMVPIAEASDCLRTESGEIDVWAEQVPSQICRLTTKSGRVIRGTHNHPVAMADGSFVDLSQLQTGQEIQLRPPMFAEKPYVETWHPVPGVEHRVELTPEWGRFLGFFMGDGSWHKGILSICCDAKDDDVVDHVDELVGALLASPHRREIARVQGRKGAVELRVGVMPARDALKALGAIGVNGESSYRREVCVPEAIWRSPKAVVREFLRGLFEADGSASANRVRWASSKRAFAQEIQLLLLGFGVNGSIREQSKTAGGGQTYTSYCIDLDTCNSQKFYDEIGFVGARKSALRPAVQTVGRSPQPITMTDEVATVEKDGFEVTYDFTISGEHVFSANGILTHNSPAEAFLATGKQVFSTMHVRRLLEETKRSPAEVTGELVAKDHAERRTRSGTIKVPAKVEWRDGTRQFPTDPLWDVWETPVEGMHYVLAVDPAKGGSGEDDDRASHAIQIIRHDTKVQVAEWSSRCDPDQVAVEVMMAALYWNKPWVAIETTGGWGLSIARRLWKDFAYPKVFTRKSFEARKEHMEDRLGWDTNRVSKQILEDGAKELLREGSHGIRSNSLAMEMSWYVRDVKGKTGPESGKHSDLLMAWMIAQQVALEKPIPQARGVTSTTAGVWKPRNDRTGY